MSNLECRMAVFHSLEFVIQCSVFDTWFRPGRARGLGADGKGQDENEDNGVGGCVPDVFPGVT